jgi:hypothetical protein
VNDFALRRVDNAMPQRSCAQTQVSILKAVLKVRIESTEFLEEIAPNGKAATGNSRRIALTVYRGVGTIEAIADVPGEFVLTDDSTCMPDSVVREELLVPNDSYCRILIERTKKSLQPTRLNESVII